MAACEYCGRLTPCPAHPVAGARKPFAGVARTSSLYQTPRWKQRRTAQLRAEPNCRACKAEGRVRRATVADHVVPHRGDERAFWSGALQSLCWPHSNQKTGRETRERIAPRRREPEKHPGARA